VISIVTPYWNGAEMMRLHLESFRRFFPDAPILVSKRGGGREEMEDYRKSFAVQYWLEDCEYEDAFLRLLGRCTTRFVCISDHDTVLLSDPAPLLGGLERGDWDLVGIEERIRNHPSMAAARLWHEDYRGWYRLSPGYMDATFLMFDLQAFVESWGLKGVRACEPHASDFELHYGICEKLRRHKYLLPFHTRRYGIGNVLKDGEQVVLWHQWYGAHRERLSEFDVADLPAAKELATIVAAGERAFLADYPVLDLTNLEPAWGKGFDVNAERCAIEAGLPAQPSWRDRTLGRLRRLIENPRTFLGQFLRWLDRRWRLR